MTITLIPKTNQEAFDSVWNQLKTQKGRSIGENLVCQYRMADGRRCAIGGMIPDDKYDPIIENLSIRDLAGDGIEIGDLDLELLIDLQRAHDESYGWDGDRFTDWEELRTIARIYHLAVPE